jgi:hypothetical protein
LKRGTEEIEGTSNPIARRGHRKEKPRQGGRTFLSRGQHPRQPGRSDVFDSVVPLFGRIVVVADLLIDDFAGNPPLLVLGALRSIEVPAPEGWNCLDWMVETAPHVWEVLAFRAPAGKYYTAAGARAIY